LIPQVKQTEKHCGICGSFMDLKLGRDKIAFWQCVQTENHREPLAA
jgi:hypothetical protein